MTEEWNPRRLLDLEKIVTLMMMSRSCGGQYHSCGSNKWGWHCGNAGVEASKRFAKYMDEYIPLDAEWTDPPKEAG